mmetsp:Transcript_26644/g.75632  ORF Transcript_26644/g.75632 Transcript_26644/m.75632 type:complete len:215 (+) Transcript_26644:323-967(+)
MCHSHRICCPHMRTAVRHVANQVPQQATQDLSCGLVILERCIHERHEQGAQAHHPQSCGKLQCLLLRRMRWVLRPGSPHLVQVSQKKQGLGARVDVQRLVPDNRHRHAPRARPRQPLQLLPLRGAELRLARPVRLVAEVARPAIGTSACGEEDARAGAQQRVADAARGGPLGRRCRGLQRRRLRVGKRHALQLLDSGSLAGRGSRAGHRRVLVR